VRLKRGMSQGQVAAGAGVSRSMVSQIEAGGLEETSLGIIRRVSAALGVSLPFEPRWRGVELAKLMDARHASMVRAVVSRLGTFGWQCIPEHTFNEWGERGSIDVLAWHAVRRAVVCVEIKTRLVDLQDLLSTEDRKRRLAPALARKLGWNPLIVGSVLVLPEETWARNAVQRHGPVFDAKFPMRTIEVRRWLRRPDGDGFGIWFLVDDARGDHKRGSGAAIRVRPAKPIQDAADPRSSRVDLAR
jgi:transcriptional regulator with XRE-family HTH domain